MELNGPTRFRPRKSTSSERFLGAFLHAPHENPSSSPQTTTTTTASNAAVELNEDDVFWTGSYSEADENQNHSQHHSTSPSTPRHLHLHHHHNNSNNHLLNYQKSFAQPEANGFGILAALPENETASPSLRNVSHFYHKASVSSSSSSSSSSSRMIPAIPKPPVDRMPLPSSVKYQSAPVNVPVMSQPTRSPHEFDDVNDDDDDGVDGEMLPPHEIVARAQSPMLACSVLEGAGRTLKGRDLRQVRNAVWRRTGGRFEGDGTGANFNGEAEEEDKDGYSRGYSFLPWKEKPSVQLRPIGGVDQRSAILNTMEHLAECGIDVMGKEHIRENLLWYSLR